MMFVGLPLVERSCRPNLMMPDAEIVFKAIRANGKISVVVALLSNGRIRQAAAVQLVVVMMMMKSRNATMMVNSIGNMPARARNA
jgi:hypothetical protein